MKTRQFKIKSFNPFLFVVCIFLGTSLAFYSILFAPQSKDVPINTFLQTHLFPTKVPEKIQTTLIFTGDVMLGRTVEITAREKYDFNYPFLKVADILRASDLTFINLENPIVENCPPHTGGFTFCTNPQMLSGLTFSGIDIVTLANNHTGNYGKDGIVQTQKFLDEKNIAYTGVNNLAIKQVNNVTFGFLGFDKAQQSNPKLTPSEEQLIQYSDKKVDVLIVAMHWGVEYKNKALPGVRKLASDLIKNGADVVVGSHPHWVQDSEKIKGADGIDRPVYYSLGNFVFDQMWSEETKKGLAVRLTFEESTLQKEEFLPIYIRQNGQPEWAR